jgi:hypothetical protein
MYLKGQAKQIAEKMRVRLCVGILRNGERRAKGSEADLHGIVNG